MDKRIEMKFRLKAGRWEAQEIWLENGRIYYLSLEYFAIKFTYDRRGFGKNKFEGKSAYFSIEVLF